MCPASPQFITRCATLMPAPAMFACSFRSRDFVDRTAVNSHPNTKFGMTLQCLTNFLIAQRIGGFEVVAKHQCATVPVGKRTICLRFRRAEMLGAADDAFNV